MVKVRSIRVISAAKVAAVLYGILGLIIAPFILLGPGLAMVGGERRGFAGAIAVAVVLPFCYAIVGFIIGALMAFLYNAISHSIGGFEVELEPLASPVAALPETPVSPAVSPVSELPPSPRPDFE